MRPGQASSPWSRRRSPNNYRAHLNLGCLDADQNRISEAIAEYRTALRINPAFAEAHYDMGVALAGIPGRLPDVIAQFETALRIKADYPDAQFNLGVALAAIRGRRSEAIAHLEAAQRMRPDWAQARRKLDELQSLP